MRNIIILLILFFTFSMQIVHSAEYSCCSAKADATSHQHNTPCDDSTQNTCDNCALCSHFSSLVHCNHILLSADTTVAPVFTYKENIYSSCDLPKYPKPPCA